MLNSSDKSYQSGALFQIPCRFYFVKTSTFFLPLLLNTNLPGENSSRKHTQGFVSPPIPSPLVPRGVAFPSWSTTEAEYCHLGSRLPLAAAAAAERSLGSGFPAPAPASYPFLSPSAHGRRPAHGARTKSRAVGPTGPGPPTLRAAGVLQPRGRGSRCNFANRKEGGAVAARVRVRPGRPARVGRGQGREGRSERAQPPRAGARSLPAGRGPRPPGARPTARPTLSRGTAGHPHARTLARPCPGGCGAEAPGWPPACPRSSTPRSGPALAAPPAAATISPHRGGGGVAAARASVGRSGRSNRQAAGPSLNPTPGHGPGPAPIHSRRPRRSRTWPWLMVGQARALTWLERRRRRRRPPGAGSARPGSGLRARSGLGLPLPRGGSRAALASHARAGGGGEGPRRGEGRGAHAYA